MNVVRLLNKFSKKFLWIIGLIVGVTFLLNYIRSLVPLLIGQVFSILENKESNLPDYLLFFFNNKEGISAIITVAVSILCVCLVREIVNVFSDFIIGYAGESIGYVIQNGFYEHVQDLPYSYLNRVETGDLIQRSTNDINRVKQFYGEVLPEMINNILKIIIYSTQIFMIVKDDLAIGFAIMGFIPIIIVLALVFFKGMVKYFDAFETNEGKVSTVVQENLTGIRVVKAFANEELEIRKERSIMNRFGIAWKNMMNRLTGYWPTGDFLGYTMLLVAFTMGALSIKNNILTLSTVVSLIFYVEYLMWPTRMLGRELSNLGRTNIAAKRILEICEMPSEYDICNGDLKEPIKGGIEFKNVGFKFDDANFPLLKNVSFKIEPGQTVSIIGKTGCGKSTLVSLINRLVEPTEGKILIDGIESTRFEKKYLRSKIGLVLQEPFLFTKTIADNIGIAQGSKDLDVIKDVSDIASVRNDIERFEEGYDTLVGERGVTLSGGQKQRISIARAIVDEKPILIFDDSLSAVDTETDIHIRNALKSRKLKSTTILITHRISTAKDSDLIIVLEDGKISNIGKHDQLIKQPGLYKEIWDIQSSIEREGE